jgi:hypothetical protein
MTAGGWKEVSFGEWFRTFPKSTTIIQNFGGHSPNYTTSHQRELEIFSNSVLRTSNVLIARNIVTYILYTNMCPGLKIYIKYIIEPTRFTF